MSKEEFLTQFVLTSIRAGHNTEPWAMHGLVRTAEEAWKQIQLQKDESNPPMPKK